MVKKELTHPDEFFDLSNNNNKPDINRSDIMERIQHRMLQTLTEMTGPVKILSSQKRKSHLDSARNLIDTQI
jgi:hypothetical protein